MPTPSRLSSRRTHRTLAGRIVYDRPRHEFRVRDLIRIEKRIDLSQATVGDLVDYVLENAYFTARAISAAFDTGFLTISHLLSFTAPILAILSALKDVALRFGRNVLDQIESIFNPPDTED